MTIIIFLILLFVSCISIGAGLAKYVLKNRLLPGFKDLADYIK